METTIKGKRRCPVMKQTHCPGTIPCDPIEVKAWPIGMVPGCNIQHQDDICKGPELANWPKDPDPMIRGLSFDVPCTGSVRY